VIRACAHDNDIRFLFANGGENLFLDGACLDHDLKVDVILIFRTHQSRQHPPGLFAMFLFDFRGPGRKRIHNSRGNLDRRLRLVVPDRVHHFLARLQH
jgi:hypothetical protein